MSGRLGCSFFLALLVLAGCDTVGRAVVSEKPSGFGAEMCKQPPPCVALAFDEPTGVPEAVEPVDLTYCPQAGGLACSATSPTPSGQCGEPVGPLELTFAGGTDASVLGCRAARLRHHAGDPLTLRIALSDWSRVRLDVDSAEPVSLELVGGQLSEVSVALHGPVTLRLLDVTRSSDLRVMSDHEQTRIELVRSTLALLAIGAATGEVLLRRSWLSGVAVQAARVIVESSYVADAAWSAQSLNAADATLRRVRSAVERSLLAACDVEMASFTECQSLTTIQGTYKQIRLAACAEDAGIYGSDLLRAQLEGDLILDSAGLTEAVLGVGEVGSIMAWDSRLTDVSFCAAEQALALGGAAGVECAHCDVGAEVTEPTVCLLDRALLRAEKSESCPVLDIPPICGDPQPKRMRPPQR